jgi:hypothetical protein
MQVDNGLSTSRQAAHIQGWFGWQAFSTLHQHDNGSATDGLLAIPECSMAGRLGSAGKIDMRQSDEI